VDNDPNLVQLGRAVARAERVLRFDPHTKVGVVDLVAL
jgi:hypothetical protein